MTNEERALDNDIAVLSSQIKEQFLENEALKPYHYITHEDCQNICKTINKQDPTKSMIIISAPKGTSLEAGEDDRGNCMLRMDSTDKGPIKVFTCKPSTGVKEVLPNRHDSM